MNIGKLSPVNIRELWKNEATGFTVWLEDNIDSLAESINWDLTVIEREKQVGTFFVDLYAETSGGEKVIIENQLEKTDHSHLGQIITYFTNLEVNNVIWIAKNARQEHMNAVNWLNEFTEINFFLVELEAYKIDNSKPAPYFKVVCKPDTDMKQLGADKKSLSDREQFNVNFWQTMMEKCSKKLKHFSGKKASKYHFHGAGAGKGGFQFVFLATGSYYGIELYIDTGVKEKNEYALKHLLSNKEKIESEFGSELIWDLIEGKRACRIRHKIKNQVNITEIDWEKAQDELIETMQQFEKVLRPKVKGIDYKNFIDPDAAAAA